MNKVKKAVECFNEGFSCSQAVLSSFCKDYELDRITALKISQSFGGGMAHMGETCGAVTGAFMVIGLKYGRIKAEDEEAKEKTYVYVREFVKKFKSSNSSIVCNELIGYDMNKPDELKKAAEKEIFTTLCPELVKKAAQILVELGF